MKRGITRRAMLIASSGLAASTAQKTTRKPRAPETPGEFVRFVDPVTEAWVVRLTATSSSSLLPAPQNRFVAAKRRFMVFSSDRTGTMTPFYLDLRSGALRELAPTKRLIPHSLCLDAHDRSVYLIDGGVLKEISLSNHKVRTVAEDVTAFGLSCSGTSLALVRGGRLFRSGSLQPIAEDVAVGPFLRPDGSGCLYGRNVDDGCEFWYVSLHIDSRPVRLARGRISCPFWSPDGKSVLFLRDVPAGSAILSEIHAVVPETGQEHRVDPTSQFAAFAPNGNASVFVGASRSKAQPNVILLLRSIARELTLCEHGASNPAAVTPVFSPDSRRIYFQSDREGKWAIYSINVENFVEPT